MSMNERKTLIAANWKMYKTPDEAVAFMKTMMRQQGLTVD